MYKMILNYCIITLIFIMISGCADEKTVTSTSVNQIVVTIIDQVHFDFKQIDDNYHIQGRIVGEPLPDFNYFRINSNVYDTEDNYSYFLGLLDFDLTFEQENALQLTDKDTIEVNSSQGVVTGFISKPSELDSIMINNTTTDYNYQIDKDQDIILTWTYGDVKPDFVHVVYWNDWSDEQTQYIGNFVSKAVPNTENSIKLFDADESNMDGDIYVNLSSINGPTSESNTLGNMTGEGSGYLFRKLLTDSGIFGIQVGAGLKNKAMTDEELIEIGRQEFKKYIMGQFGMEN